MQVRDQIVNIEPLVGRVSRPGRYVGGEWNEVRKDWDACSVRMALAYPDIYDIGMSNLGLGILYDLVNRQRWLPGRARLRALAGHGSRDAAPARRSGRLNPATRVRDFDLIGFSLSYEMDYTNILNMLDLAGVPVLAAERGRRRPDCAWPAAAARSTRSRWPISSTCLRSAKAKS